MTDDELRPRRWPPRAVARRCEDCGGPLHPLPIGVRRCQRCVGDAIQRLVARGIAELELMLAAHAP
jgi:hypothetical protein